MSDGILFDNFIITDNKRVADQWAADGWQLKKSEESSTDVSEYCCCCNVSFIAIFTSFESSAVLFHMLLSVIPTVLDEVLDKTGM